MGESNRGYRNSRVRETELSVTGNAEAATGPGYHLGFSDGET